MEDSNRKREIVIEKILNAIEERIKEEDLKQRDILRLCEKKDIILHSLNYPRYCHIKLY